MRLSTTPTGELFTDRHVVDFLKAFGIEGVKPTKVCLRYKARGDLPILYLDLDHEVSDAIVLDTYYLYASDIDARLTALFDLPEKGAITKLEFNWEKDSIAQLEVTHALSVLDPEFKPTGFKAIKVGE